MLLAGAIVTTVEVETFPNVKEFSDAVIGCFEVATVLTTSYVGSCLLNWVTVVPNVTGLKEIGVVVTALVATVEANAEFGDPVTTPLLVK